MRASTSLLSALLLTSALAGCTSAPEEDPYLYMTGTEELAVIMANGQLGCTNPKKVLICHIPPGNPANAHEICVSENAVDTHQSHHGDTIDLCDGTTPPPDGGGGGGETPDAGGTPDAGNGEPVP